MYSLSFYNRTLAIYISFICIAGEILRCWVLERSPQYTVSQSGAGSVAVWVRGGSFHSTVWLALGRVGMDLPSCLLGQPNTFQKENIFQASTMKLSGLKMFNFVLEFRRISHKWAPRNYKKPACKPCCFVYILTTSWVRKYGCKINTFSAIFVSQPWDWLAE